MNLQDFCSKDWSRNNVAAPWSYGDYSIATDGHILIRVPLLADVPGNPDAPKIEKLFTETIAVGEWLEVPDLPDLEYDSCKECNGVGKLPKKCDRCDGEGHIECSECGNGTKECRHCDGSGLSDKLGLDNCESCDGSGKKRKAQPVKVGTEHVDARFLRLIKDLPGVTIANSEKMLGPLVFRFDGGDGLIMPMRV